MDWRGGGCQLLGSVVGACFNMVRAVVQESKTIVPAITDIFRRFQITSRNRRKYLLYIIYEIIRSFETTGKPNNRAGKGLSKLTF